MTTHLYRVATLVRDKRGHDHIINTMIRATDPDLARRAGAAKACGPGEALIRNVAVIEITVPSGGES